MLAEPETQVDAVARAAGFWRRFLGMVLDSIVIGVVATAIRFGVGRWLGELISLLLGAVYFTYFHGSTGQTPGNAALGIRVVDVETSRPVGFQRAFLRYLVSIVSTFFVLLGYLWMLWDGRKQTWHDKAAGSLPIVVRR